MLEYRVHAAVADRAAGPGRWVAVRHGGADQTSLGPAGTGSGASFVGPAGAAFARTFATETAITLYSGQLVLMSEEEPTSRFVRTSGKWNAVNTCPGSIRSVSFAASVISPLRLRTSTRSPSATPAAAASSG